MTDCKSTAIEPPALLAIFAQIRSALSSGMTGSITIHVNRGQPKSLEARLTTGLADGWRLPLASPSE